MIAIQMDFSRTDQPGPLENNKCLKITTTTKHRHSHRLKGDSSSESFQTLSLSHENREYSVSAPATALQPKGTLCNDAALHKRWTPSSGESSDHVPSHRLPTLSFWPSDGRPRPMETGQTMSQKFITAGRQEGMQLSQDVWSHHSSFTERRRKRDHRVLESILRRAFGNPTLCWPLELVRCLTWPKRQTEFKSSWITYTYMYLGKLTLCAPVSLSGE